MSSILTPGEIAAIKYQWNTLVGRGDAGPLKRQPLWNDDVDKLIATAERLAAVEAELQQVRELLADRLCEAIYQCEQGRARSIAITLPPMDAHELRALITNRDTVSTTDVRKAMGDG